MTRVGMGGMHQGEATVAVHAARLSGGGDGDGRGRLRQALSNGAGDRDRGARDHCALDDARDLAGGKPAAARTDGRHKQILVHVRTNTHRGAM